MEIPADGHGHHDGSDGAHDPCAEPSAQHVERVFAILLVSEYLYCWWSEVGGRRRCVVGVLGLFVLEIMYVVSANGGSVRVLSDLYVQSFLVIFPRLTLFRMTVIKLCRM